MSKTSIAVFRSFITANPHDGTLDASMINSRACYEAWLIAQKKMEESEQDPKKFHRALTNHVSGVDGRHPFEKSEEQAILIELRKKTPWPCFPDAPIGWGYRGKGYHEKLELNLHAPPPAAAAAKRAKQARHETPNVVVAVPPLTAVAEEEDDGNFVDKFADKLIQYANSFAVLGFEEYKQINAIVRFVVLSKTNAVPMVQPTEDYAQQLVSQFSSSNGVAVFVTDLTNKEFEKRFLAQNEEARMVFGDQVGKYSIVLTQKQDFSKQVVAVLSSISTLGKTYATTQMLKTATGAVNLFDTSYTMDPLSHLLIMTAKPVRETQTEFWY